MNYFRQIQKDMKKRKRRRMRSGGSTKAASAPILPDDKSDFKDTDGLDPEKSTTAKEDEEAAKDAEEESSEG